MHDGLGVQRNRRLSFVVACQIDAGAHKKQAEDETDRDLLAEDHNPRGHSEKWGKKSEHGKLRNGIGVDQLEPRQIRCKGHDDRGVKQSQHSCSVHIEDPLLLQETRAQKNDGDGKDELIEEGVNGMHSSGKVLLDVDSRGAPKHGRSQLQ